MVYKSSTQNGGGGGGAGTVTQINTGTGLAGGPITTTGTISITDNTPNTLSGFDDTGEFSGVGVGDGLSLIAGVLTATGEDTGITQLTGDVTAGPGSGSQAATLATVNVNVGTFGSSTSIPTLILNAKGLVTGASGNAVVAPAGTLTGTTLASNVVTSSLTSVSTLVGGATGAGFTIALSASTITGALPTANAGTASGGTTGQVLTKSSNTNYDYAWATPTTGTVTSVSGTPDRITSTGGATPAIDIAATYVGQTSLTTLGTITTGIWNAGTVTVTSNSSSALTVGLSGATNPVLKVDASTGSQADGISITGGAAGGGTTITSISSGSDSPLTLNTKGASALQLQTAGTGLILLRPAGTTRWTFGAERAVFAPTTNSTAATIRFSYTGAADTSLTGGAEAPEIYFNMGQIRTHASNTAITLQRDFRITGSTHAFASSGGTITDMATIAIDGYAQAGTNATVTNAHGLYIPTQAVAGTVTNAYGISVAAPSGAATNNYAINATGTVAATLFLGPLTGNASTATALQNARTLWGQSFDGTGNVTGSLTAVGNITGGASSMTITAGTGNSRTLTLQTTTSGGTATNAVVFNATQDAAFVGNVDVPTAKVYTYNSQNAIRATTANGNWYFGPSGNLGNTTHSSITAVGAGALVGVGVGDASCAVGFNALGDGSNTGNDNLAFGAYASWKNTSGANNCSFGSSALVLGTTASRNVGVGREALQGNVLGSDNVAIGYQAGFSFKGLTASTYNVFIGSNSGRDVAGDGAADTPYNNTMIGGNTGRGITTGSGNTIIGANVSGLSTTLTNNIIIANGGGSGSTGVKLQNDGTNWTVTGSLGITGSRVSKLWATDIESTNAPTIGGTSATGTGGLVLATSPTLVTPNIGVAAGTSLDVSGVLESGVNSATGGQLKMFGSTSGDVTLKVAAAAGTATVFQLPATNGSNTNVLQTDGNGITSWVAASGSGANTALSNLASVAINTSLLPGSDDGAALGSTTKEFSDLFLATGGVINWAAGNATITHSTNKLSHTGASTGYTFDNPVAISAGTTSPLAVNGTPKFQLMGTDIPTSTMMIACFDATVSEAGDFRFYRSKNAAIGSATVVASGDNLGSITWYGAQQTGTFSNTNTAAQIRCVVGGTVTSGAGADMPGKLIFSTTPDGSGTVTDQLTLFANGDAQLATAGSNAASIVTVGGTQTLTNKTLTSPTMTAPVLGAASATSLTFSSTSGIIGTTTNDSAAAGSVGETIESTVLVGAAVSMTSPNAANVTSISLTAGDWDVWGNVATSANALTTTTLLAAWISTTSATVPTIPNSGAYTQYQSAVPAGGAIVVSAGSRRLSLSGTTTVYLSALAVFATNTLSTYGYIGARRRR